MNTFTRKALYAAIAGVAAVGVASTAEAVNLSADGLGQVLIYPYYTVRTNASGLGYNTLMSVVNTTGSVKAVKVRFREGKNSVEVLDFNVFLSPYDVWTATITATADGAQISTTDKSCTVPARLGQGTPEPFRTTLLDPDDNSPDRTREGYFEIFEMSTEVGTTATKATHVSGVPPCGITEAQAQVDARLATGGLFGGLIIVNPAGGGAFSQAATALANFNPNLGYQNAGGPSPDYGDAFPPISNVIQDGVLYSTNWNVGFDAVTAALLGNAVTNEYVLDTGTKSQTSWIITMPTKFAYVNSSPAIRPFTHTYVSGKGACEETFAVVFNREEAAPQIVTIDDFSPPSPTAPGPTICWEATSVNFNQVAEDGTTVVTASNVFGSKNINTLSTKFSNGWATFAFNDLGIVTSPPLPAVHLMAPQGGSETIAFDLAAGDTSFAQVTYYGLPVVGFAAETFQNDALLIGGKSFLSIFGAEFVHHKTTRIEQVVP
jgi:hypothetical protein